MRRTLLVLGLVAVAGLAATACGDGSDEFDTGASDAPRTTHTPPVDDAVLALGDGLVLVSTEVRGHQLVEGTHVRLRVDGERLVIEAGCNTMSGEVAVAGGRLVVGSLTSTMMGCEPPLMAQDEWVGAFFESGPAVTFDGSTLELTSDDGTTIVLAEEPPAEDAPLVGPTWVATTIVEGDVVSSVPGEPPTFTFHDDGTVEVFDGCNRGAGRYAVDGERLTFDGVALTEIACATAPLVADLLAGGPRHRRTHPVAAHAGGHGPRPPSGLTPAHRS